MTHDTDQEYVPQYTPIEELYAEKAWTYTRSLDTKAPAADWATNQMTYEEALAHGTKPFYVSSMDSRFIVLDIDTDKKIKQANIDADDATKRGILRDTLSALPAELKAVIKNTYATKSVSGMGLHVFITSSDLDKPAIGRNYLKSKTVGELYINGNGTVHLRDQVAFDKPILDVPAEILAVGWPKLLPKSESGVSSSNAKVIDINTRQEITGDNDAAKLDMPILVRDLPWGSESPAVIKAFDKIRDQVEYGRYEFWVTVGMCLYDWGNRTGRATDAMLAFVEWSKTDPDGYDDDEAILDKYSTFKEELANTDLSYKTLYHIIKLLRYDWPEPSSKSKGPVFDSLANLEYYLEFHDVRIYLVPGSEQIVLSATEGFGKRFFSGQHAYPGFYGPYPVDAFKKRLTNAMQIDGWQGITIPKADTIIKTILTETTPFNPVRLWLDTPYDELEEKYRLGYYDPANPRTLVEINEFDDNATLDYICDQVTLLNPSPQQEAYKRRILRCFFCGFLKLQYPDRFGNAGDFFSRFSNNGGMMLLIGDEHSYKTTFFKVLLPDHLASFSHHLPKMDGNSSDSDRRFLMDLSRPGYGIMDEFDGNNKKWLNTNFKEYLTADEVSVQLKYRNAIETRPRQCMIGGTSNEFKQVFSDTGSRRVWTLVIDQINTTNLVRVNWHKFYQDLMKEMQEDILQGLTPWVPDRKTISLIYEQNAEVKAENTTEITLKDFFRTEAEYPDIESLLNAHYAKHGSAQTIAGHLQKAKYAHQVASEKRIPITQVQREFENMSLKLVNARKGKKYPLSKGGQGAYYCNGKIYIARRMKADGTLTNGNAYWVLPEEISDFEVTDE